MSLFPEFELGLWNAWIITVLGFILPWIPSYINKEATKKRMEEIKWGEFSKTVKTVLIIAQVIIMPFTIIYSFFLPLKLGTVWFYVGLPISILGIIMPVISGVSLYGVLLHHLINPLPQVCTALQEIQSISRRSYSI